MSKFGPVSGGQCGLGLRGQGVVCGLRNGVEGLEIKTAEAEFHFGFEDLGFRRGLNRTSLARSFSFQIRMGSA